MNDWPRDPVRGLVDLAGQVQVEASEHAQRRGLLVRGVDGSQGVGHGPDRAGDDGSVLGVGLGAAWRQVGDAAHRQPGQIAHGDALLLGHRHRQNPDGGGLRACQGFCVSGLQVGVDSVGVCGGGAGPGPCI